MQQCYYLYPDLQIFLLTLFFVSTNRFAMHALSSVGMPNATKFPALDGTWNPFESFDSADHIYLPCFLQDSQLQCSARE
jgi:hypothetical protein